MDKIREKYEVYKKYIHYYPIGSVGSIKKYEDGHVFDENQSVKWNREEVVRRNEEYRREVEARREDKQKAFHDFIDAGIKYIMREFAVGDELAGEIWSFCADKTNTIEERLEFLDELAYLFGKE